MKTPRITELLMSHRTSKDHLIQAPCSKKGHLEHVAQGCVHFPALCDSQHSSELQVTGQADVQFGHRNPSIQHFLVCFPVTAVLIFSFVICSCVGTCRIWKESHQPYKSLHAFTRALVWGMTLLFPLHKD